MSDAKRQAGGKLFLKRPCGPVQLPLRKSVVHMMKDQFFEELVAVVAIFNSFHFHWNNLGTTWTFLLQSLVLFESFSAVRRIASSVARPVQQRNS